MQTIDWSFISDEQFQSLCVKLLFREKYRNIMPLGSRGIKEGGRDAIDETVIAESKENRRIVFQFKRWTADYSDTAIKRMVREELDTKIMLSGEIFDEYRLVTCHPLTRLKRWFSGDLSREYTFPVKYFEKSWLENRLESESQDLRRSFFGIDIERHSTQSLKEFCWFQSQNAIHSVGSKYIPDLYVKRSIEDEIQTFLKSNKACFFIVDRSGQGKTNLLCHLADVLHTHMPVLLISGSRTISTEQDLAKYIIDELGYASPPGTRWQYGLDDVIKISQRGRFVTLVLIDGISENNEIVNIKRALRELLDKYGRQKHIKFIVTCRDTLWTRFRTEFPEEYVYKTKSQTGLSGDEHQEIGHFLGDWSDVDFEEVSRRYAKYFNIQFNLSPVSKNHCKYPLLLRLFCETYKNKDIGFVSALPFRKVFDEYFETKIQRLADYFGIDASHERIRACILGIREEMWINQDRNDLGRDNVDQILKDSGFSSTDAITTRMYDEGIFIKTYSGQREYLRFAFDELSDYLLFLILSEKYLHSFPSDIERVNEMCRILREDNHDQIALAEKYLVLLSRNTEDPSVHFHLLDSVLNEDLNIFSQCVWYGLAIHNSPSRTEAEMVERFSEQLVHFYDKTLTRFFSAIKPVLDPFTDDKETLGVKVRVAPNLRELSYFYKIVKANERQLEIKFTDKFPTWTLSFDGHNLHDPEAGILIPVFRDHPAGGVLRTLNFEWNSPFNGVSLQSPAKIALNDIWDEITHALENRFLGIQPSIEEKSSSASSTFSWRQYSEEQFLNQIQAVFGGFMQVYSALIGEQFIQASQYFNLYRQLPASLAVLVDSFRKRLRVYVLPVAKEDEARLSVHFLEKGVGDDISSGDARFNNNMTHSEVVRWAMAELDKTSSIVSLIDMIFSIEELFQENSVNNLLVNRIKSDLAQLLRAPFH